MKNTWVRTVSGICFLAIMVAGFLVHPYFFAALHVFILVCMMIEFYKMAMDTRFKVPRLLGILTGVSLFIITFLVVGFDLKPRLFALNVIPLVAVMVSIMYSKDKTGFKDLAFLFMGLFYIAPPVAAANALVFGKDGTFSGMLILSFFCIIWASDVGAYVFGHLFGEHGKKLFPSVSPKKSWAGFWGGLVLALITAVIIHYCGLFNFPIWHCLALAVVLDVAGVYGDLFESQWKRTLGYKDSGNIIPGHGGMLDRFDSALFAIPGGLAYILFTGIA